jgi:hypothetical protein
MTDFVYIGNENKTFDEIELSKSAFIDKLGPFKDEFDQYDGTVTINFNLPPDDENFYQFGFRKQHNLSDFIRRWNDYIRSLS